MTNRPTDKAFIHYDERGEPWVCRWNVNGWREWSALGYSERGEPVRKVLIDDELVDLLDAYARLTQG